jgi:hypothetical protein
VCAGGVLAGSEEHGDSLEKHGQISAIKEGIADEVIIHLAFARFDDRNCIQAVS